MMMTETRDTPGARVGQRIVIDATIPYGLGHPGYEWVNDYLIRMNPRAYRDLIAYQISDNDDPPPPPRAR